MSLSVPPELREVQGHKLLVMLEVMHLVAKADGFFCENEFKSFLEYATELSAGKFSNEHLSRLIASWGKRDDFDVVARLEELATLLPETDLRKISFDLGKQIARADGKVVQAEKDLLRSLAETFDLKAGS